MIMMKIFKMTIIAVLGSLVVTSCARYQIKGKKNNNIVGDPQKLGPGDGSCSERIQDDAVICGDNADGSAFFIMGRPYQVFVGDVVHFTSRCGVDDAGVLTWDFADGETSKEKNLNHSFKAAGKYPVKGICEIPGATDLIEGVITITVTARAISPNPGQNPSQNPNQN